jgi:PglZ domain.
MKNNWRESILKEFQPGINRLTLAADPDSLLTEEKMAITLRERGFELIEFSDHIEFRYAYESKYRSAWDQNIATDLVVILHLAKPEFQSLPYDLLKAGREVSFSLGHVFPNFSYRIIEGLDRSLLDDLYEVQSTYPPDRLGDNASIDYVLRHVYKIASELIHNEAELLHTLLRIHYGRITLSPDLSKRLVSVLGVDPAFKSWPLDLLISDEQAFFSFLQERWPTFIEHQFGTLDQWKSSETALHYPGPSLLPFDHHDIKVYIDNLFIENKLKPIDVGSMSISDDLWLNCGLLKTDDQSRKIMKLFDTVASMPTADSRYADWAAFALKWAELTALVYDCEDGDYISQLENRSRAMNSIFIDWLKNHYAGLMNLPPANPVMLHHVPRFLARNKEARPNIPVALLVVDGLSLGQWVTVRTILAGQNNELEFRENGIFAWIPTLTAVSRQALFSGKAPYYFPSSIKSTSGEEKLWKLFWENQGVARQDIAYMKGLSDGDPAVIDTVVNPSKTMVAGLIVDMVDRIMHGTQLGSSGMHGQIKQWARKGFPAALISRLLDYGYEVWLTSDHGNVACTGRGQPSEGVLAETKGQRARIYSSRELRSQTADSFPFAHQWPRVGLPDDFYPLLAGLDDAFAPEGSHLVSHGGLSLEEIIVPFVKIERKSA